VWDQVSLAAGWAQAEGEAPSAPPPASNTCWSWPAASLPAGLTGGSPRGSPGAS